MNQVRKTIDDIRSAKGQTPLVTLTAYTAPMAKILDPHCDILLVGDSLGMVLYGMKNTLGVSLVMMIEHGKAVMRGSENALVVVDMPYATYEDNDAQALENAKLLMKETGAQAVKIEGHAERVKHLVDHGIAVMGHIGLLPQSVEIEGGYKIKGKSDEDEKRLIEEARAMEEAGAFAIVIEGTVEPVSRAITEAIGIPTIGIGASAACDGQVLVTEDMVGMFENVPRFVKKYTNLAGEIEKAAEAYASDVRARTFPADEHTYGNTSSKPPSDLKATG